MGFDECGDLFLKSYKKRAKNRALLFVIYKLTINDWQ